MDCPKCKEPNMHLASHCTLWCMACDHTIGPDERIAELEAENQKLKHFELTAREGISVRRIHELEAESQRLREAAAVMLKGWRTYDLELLFEGGDALEAALGESNDD